MLLHFIANKIRQTCLPIDKPAIITDNVLF